MNTHKIHTKSAQVLFYVCMAVVKTFLNLSVCVSRVEQHDIIFD